MLRSLLVAAVTVPLVAVVPGVAAAQQAPSPPAADTMPAASETMPMETDQTMPMRRRSTRAMNAEEQEQTRRLNQEQLSTAGGMPAQEMTIDEMPAQ